MMTHYGVILGFFNFLPEYRGKGIGTKLMKKILKELKNQGTDSVSLSVDPNNPAIRLYKRLGFEEVNKVGTSITMKLTI